MSSLPESLRDDVRLLGELLGASILAHQGPALFDKIEAIRHLSKALAQAGHAEATDYQPLVRALGGLADAEILPIARAFNQFLNLANIADQHYFQGAGTLPPDGLAALLAALGVSHGRANLATLLADLRIELVLTAHPTEATRRTLIHKYEAVASALSELKRSDLPGYRLAQTRERLARVIEEIWTTDEIRTTRPTAVDEAKWGFAVIENSLWQALPDLLRHLDQLSQTHLGQTLPAVFTPFRFFSWMGGDRDGNPNVTAAITREVVLLGRWKAADLCLKDLIKLGEDLSMEAASADLLQTLDGETATPYRALLHRLRQRLQATLDWTAASLKNPLTPEPAALIRCRADLLEILDLCHASLLEQRLFHVAHGPLLDLIRKIHAFGINLLPLDIRQHSGRHAAVLDELTVYLGLGSYRDWDEDTRQLFLLDQLGGKRPLLPRRWPHSEESGEVLDTFRVLAEQPREALSHYVISMATRPSDVLAVVLLLQESGLDWHMPVVPLFETLDDLTRAPAIMATLWQLPWYREHCNARQTVMIGYSDSAKDAGKFAASWALYECQEQLVAQAEQLGIKLSLFHGRGGTIGRGGGPLEKAMASQPPRSVQGSIRVTEQGEMIRYKFGMPTLAFHSLSLYLQATLRATLDPAPPPLPEWRALMDQMSAASLNAYRGIVQEHPDFVRYFRSLTPEQELNKLALGSRPARRNSEGGVESLRAIPWMFAWTQVRLNLPGWLGIRQALETALQTSPAALQAMLHEWPFFASFIDLIEMVLGKTDSAICTHYETRLVDPGLHALGSEIRADLAALTALINGLKQQAHLLDSVPMLQQSIDVRKPYIDPLNYLQTELLKRERNTGRIAPELEQALKVTMSGIAAGMRNTG